MFLCRYTDSAIMVSIMVRNAVLIGIVLLLGQNATDVTASPLDSMRLEVNQLRADVAKSEGELANLDREIETTTKEIIHLYQQIDGHERALDAQQRTINSRIQDVYKNYDYLILSVFLDARDFSDLWKRFSFLARVNRADHDLLTANRSRAEKVKELKAELAEKKRTQLELKRRKQGEFAVIRQTYEFKQAELERRLAEMRDWQARMASMKGRSFGLSN